ncbi:PH domain-containing protein [Mesotoga sp. H07.pep.5.3]|uniref:PH domain-containing protein n=1 Tax=Mesotoga sp. H07.pep.5.3 TaxID=1421003 RepID=UPI000C176A3B|nr:PH domain-containing protein [Mesotoga sp. H07.pep.5.3]PIJ61562.1 hypothetical protein V513_09495 [Mesotoga sp. H07.pep.5.3]
METIVFKFSLPTSAIMLNIGIVIFVGAIFIFSLFKTKGWQKTISLIITGSLFVFFIFLFLIFPFTNAVKFDGENVVLNALPFGRKTIAIDSAEIVGIIDWTEERNFEPTVRTNGASTGLYKVGWFRLRNGSKAFIMTARSKAFVMKSEDIYYLISPDELQEFADVIYSN